MVYIIKSLLKITIDYETGIWQQVETTIVNNVKNDKFDW